MPRALGCDIGDQATKIAVLDGSAKKPKLQAFHIVPTPEALGADARGHEPLGARIREEKLPRDQIAVSFPSREAIFRKVLLPFADEEQVRKTIKFEAESFLYSINIDDVVVTHFLTHQDAEHSQALVGAIKKDDIRRRLRALEPFDIDPPLVELDVTALSDALRATGFLEEHPQALVLDLGARGARVAAFVEGRIVYVRSLRIGFVPPPAREDPSEDPRSPANGRRDGAPGNGAGNGGIAERLAARERDEEETEPAELEPPPLPDLSPPRLEPQARDAYLEKIARELQASLAAISLPSRVTEVWITGGGLGIPGVLDEIERRAGIPARRLDLLARIDHAIPPDRQDDVIPFLPIALGLGLRQLGLESPSPGLRQEDLRYARRFDQLKLSLAAISFVAVIFLLLQNMYLYWNRKVDRVSLAAIAARSEGSRRRTIPQIDIDPEASDYERIIQIQRAFRGWKSELERELGRSEQIPDLESSFEVSIDFWNTLQKAETRLEGPMRVSLLNVQLDKHVRELKFNGHVAKGSDFDEIVNAFEAEPWVRSVTRTQVVPSEGGGFDFQNLKVELEERAPKEAPHG